jgi:hypothetical protein
MIGLIIVLCILGYAVLGKIVYNFNDFLFGFHKYSESELLIIASVFFPLSLSVLLFWKILKFPFKLADFVCNPENYKFKLKIERRD